MNKQPILMVVTCPDTLNIVTRFLGLAASKLTGIFRVPFLLNLLILLGFLMPAHAQPAKSRKKENYDIRKFDIKTIQIADPEAKKSLMHLGAIEVLDVRADTDRVGLFQKGPTGIFQSGQTYITNGHTDQTITKRPRFLVLDNGLRQDITRFANACFGFPANTSDPSVLMVVSKLWLTDELELEKETPGIILDRKTSNSYKWKSGVDLQVAFYLKNGSDYFAMYKFDTLFNKQKLVYEYGPEYLSQCLLFAMARLPEMETKLGIILKKHRFSLEEIKAHYGEFYQVPVLKADHLNAGVYTSYDEFKNNDPAQKKYSIRKDKISDNLYIPQPNGTELIARDIWGYCDGTYIYIRSADNFFMLQRLNNAFYVYGANELAMPLRNITNPSTPIYGSRGEVIGYSPATSNTSVGKYEVLLKPFVLNWETGKLY